MQGWVYLVCLFTYWGGIPAKWLSPIPVLIINQAERKFIHATNNITAMAKPPTVQLVQQLVP